MHRFHISRTIAAPPSRVWQVLTDRDLLASGGFGLTRLDAPTQRLAEGQTLRLVAEVSGKRVFTLRIAEMIPERRMVWRGGMPFGLFIGTRTFRLTEEGDGTQFEMEEVFTGPLARLIGRSLPDLTPSFITFAGALASHSERELS